MMISSLSKHDNIVPRYPGLSLSMFTSSNIYAGPKKLVK